MNKYLIQEIKLIILITTVLILNLIVYFMPKRLSPIELLTTTLFAMYLQLMTDVFLSLKYNLYGYFDEGVDWRALIYMFGIYPAINVIFLNYYPYKSNVIKSAFYVFAWSVFAMIYETIFIWSGTFYLDGWKQTYSLILYPILYIILMIFHRLTQQMRGKS